MIVLYGYFCSYCREGGTVTVTAKNIVHYIFHVRCWKCKNIESILIPKHIPKKQRLRYIQKIFERREK